MRVPLPLRALIVTLVLVAAIGVALPVRAAGGPRSTGSIALSLPGGANGPLVLTPGQGGWVGQLTVTNLGDEPLLVSRLAIRGDEDDVRSPARLGVRFVDGAAASATLSPGAAKDLVISWMPDRDPRMRQAFGHVVVTSTDERAGEVAMGFRAQLPTGLGWVGGHVLSCLVALPLLVVLLAAAARVAGRRDERMVRGVALGVSVIEALLALWMWARFAPDVARADGNDGFQFVERAVWVRAIGAEWYVGVDGVNVTLVVLAALLGLVSLVAVRPGHLRTDAYSAAHALLMSSVMAALVGLDLVLLFAAWQTVLVAVVMLLGGWGGPRSEQAAAKVATYGTLGSASMLAAFVALSRSSGRAYLVDGTTVLHTLSIPELARTSFASKGSLLGLPFVETTWLLLFTAVAIATPIVPLHGWLPDALEEAPSGVAILLAGVVSSLGPYLLVRVGLGAMPEGARWAGSSLAAVGVLSVVYGGLCAMAQRDLRRFVAYASIASSGACLFGVGSFSSQGIAGAVTGVFAHGLSAAILLGVAGAMERRVHTCDLARLRGLAGEAPALAVVTVVGLAVSLGVPTLVGFWGPLLALLGGFARHPVLALVMAMAMTVSAAAHLRVGSTMLLGRVDVGWRRSLLLEPFGGRLPDMTPPELAALVPLALLALLLGLWPAPLLSSVAAGVRDESATVDPSSPDFTP